MTLIKPRAVIFDWDDTIVDSWPNALLALNAALTAMGEGEWTDAEARARCGASARDLFRQLFGDRWQDADKVYYETYHAVSAKNMRIHENAEEILKLLGDLKIYMAVVSNKRGPMLRAEAERTRLDKYFGRIVGAGDASADKPDPAPVHMALEGSGIKPGQDVWFIGDSHADMLCALNAGCSSILLETKPPPEESLLKNPPMRRAKGHLDIMNMLRQYSQI